MAGDVIELVLEGIDYDGYIVLNGERLGEHTGMYVPFRRRIDSLLRHDEPNELLVVLRGIPQENHMYGYTSQTVTQKARCNYKWDFCARVVNIGLYDEVYIRSYRSCAVRDADLRPRRAEDGWRVEAAFTLEGFTESDVTLCYELNGCRGSEPVHIHQGENHVHVSIEAGHPALWWPAGHGGQPLYTLRLQINDDDGISDEKSWRVGFRTLEYRRTDGAGEEALPYNAVINGKRIYLKGVNVVPFDLLYGCVSETRYRRILAQMRDANINAVRVWGGGLIEKEIFYDVCDELGILVWQDFIQSSSSIEDVPSKRPEFLRLLEDTAAHAVKDKRNHVCLTYWCGGNELTDERFVHEPRATRNDHPARYEDRNIALLKRVVDTHDGARLMLPTTGSGPHVCLATGRSGELHDIHGPWQHLGPQEHYRLLNDSTSMLHSEVGCDGMSSLGSLRRCLSPEHIGAFSGEEDPDWWFHSDWNSYAYRESKWFGRFENEELEDLITCSQFLQAEGVRYEIESNRRRMWENCGNLIWQFNEPWPNVCCTNLVEYYGTEKLAYYAVRNSYRPLLVSARYDRMVYREGEPFECDIHLTNEWTGGPYRIVCKLYDGNGVLRLTKEMTGEIASNTSLFAGSIGAELTDTGTSFVLSLEAETAGGKAENRYLLLMEGADGLTDRRAVLSFVAECRKLLSCSSPKK